MNRLPQITIGICAYNEEKNIEGLLNDVLAQRLESAALKEVFIVSSGSVDGTERIARRFEKKDSRVRLFVEPFRKGKVSAVNIILKKARGDIIVLASADLRLKEDTIEKLIEKFDRPEVGMVGGRPVPVNSPDGFFGFCGSLVWDLHHKVSLVSPKCGELVAFRNREYRIPPNITVDEAYLEYIVKSNGLGTAYAERAIAYNKAPANISDYISQRRRNHAHHLHLGRVTGYRVSTDNAGMVCKALISQIRMSPKPLAYTAGAIALEGVSILLGYYDVYLRGNIHGQWEIVRSTKELGRGAM
jgi:glycosyltransferase involved in cell wall biosynthesis